MPKFFVDQSLTEGELFRLSPADLHHLVEVLRAKSGDCVTVGDSGGRNCSCILRGEAPYFQLEVQTIRPCQSETPYRVELFQALPKGDKLEHILQKAVELGVSAVTPVRTAHSLLKLDESKLGKKLERWQKIMQSAAEQSGRALIPELHVPLNFAEALARMQTADLAFAAWEGEEQLSLKALLGPAVPARVAFLIGPEGGLAAAEVAALKAASIPTISLGPRILRTETAAPAVLAQLSFAWEQSSLA